MALLRSCTSRGNTLVVCSTGRESAAWRHERATRRGNRALSSRSSHDGRTSSAVVVERSAPLRSMCVSHTAAVGKVTARYYSASSQAGGDSSSEWMTQSRHVWSVIGLGALGCGTWWATSTLDSSARTEGNDTRTDDKIKRAVVEQDNSARISAVERHLRKRRTCGKDRLLISTAAVRGDRSRMEDTSFVSDCKRFSAVFDGHGGSAVAEHLKAQLFPAMAPELTRLDQESESENNSLAVYRTVQDMLRRSVEKVDAEVLARPDWKFQGSTAVGVMLYDEAIFSFNVGDSRAVMSRGGQVIELTRDHKPNDPIEKRRVEELGGSVKWYGYVDAEGEPIEPYGAYRINGNLAVSRAIGDRDLRPFVSGEVEIKQFDRDFDKDEFIVIASDGLWDVFTSEEAVTFVHDVLSGELGGRESWRSGGHSDTSVPIFEWSHQYKSDRGMIKAARARRKTQIANYLVQEALFRGTSDNVSVIVLWLK